MDIIDLRTYFSRSIPDIIKKMGACSFATGNSYLVQVTYINDPSSFYIRLSTLEDAVKLLEVCGAPVTEDELSVGQYIVYKSLIAKHFVRGRIQTINECEKGLGMFCNIFAIDYGFIDLHVLVKDIFLPEEISLRCGPLAIQCRLNTCEPLGKTFDDEAIHAMKFFVGKYTSKMIIQYNTPSKLHVDLKTVECHEDVATILAVLGFTSVYRRIFQNPRGIGFRNRYDYKHRQMRVGEKLHVRVLSGSTVFGFHVAEMKDYIAYDNVIEWYKFTKYCMNQPQLDVIGAAMDGRACGVKVLNPVRYERAVVKRVTVPNAKALVQLLDWGKEIEANFEDLKAVTGNFLDKPAMALYCTADRILGLNYGLALRMIYPGLQFLLQIMDVGNRFRIPHRVKLYPLFPTSGDPSPLKLSADPVDLNE